MGEARPLNLLNITAWLISTCSHPRPFFLLALGKPCPSSMCPRSMCKGKDKKPVDKQWKEKMQKAYERGIKQISMIDMASKETRKKTNKREGKQARKKTKGGVPSMDNTLASKTYARTCKQACKDA